jgi:hypothetical protein
MDAQLVEQLVLAVEFLVDSLLTKLVTFYYLGDKAEQGI